jgi:hypothetical protein
MKYYLDNTRVTLICYILFFGLSHLALGIIPLWVMAKSDHKLKSFGFLNLKTCEIMLITER